MTYKGQRFLGCHSDRSSEPAPPWVAPLNTSIADFDGDGQPDLVATFDSSQIHLSPRATALRLNGCMTNSQRFRATAPVTIVNGMSTQPAQCQQ